MDFAAAKIQFDELYKHELTYEAPVPIHLTHHKRCTIQRKNDQPLEEYYKWQFIFALLHSGLYQADYIGTEVEFPKGNKNSSTIKFDGAIFDSPEWFSHYESWWTYRQQEELDWLRLHLVAVMEFKRDTSENMEVIFNQQLKPAMKESEAAFVVGFLYVGERLFIFRKSDGKCIRYDDNNNLKGDASTTKELSLHMPDAYYKIPSISQLLKKLNYSGYNVSTCTVDDLDTVTGIYSKQLNEGIFNILKAMDKVGMKNQRGYEILIQVLAIKIFDESHTHPYLNFYITQEEKNYTSLNEDSIQGFIARMRMLYNQASQEYHYILKRMDTETIVWEKDAHIRIICEVVEQFQPYSFTRSQKTDLYQIVFYKFANEFSKADKGQFITPLPIIDFLVRVVNPRGNDRIIDPTCGIADFLSMAFVNAQAVNHKLRDSNIFALDNDEQMIMLAQLNMLLNGDGNSNLRYKPDWGSIRWKFNAQNELVQLIPKLHKNGNWDEWKDGTKLKKFSVVLTNPPFGENRKLEPKTQADREILEMYELWNTARCTDWIDPGLIFLENAYRILDENGRLGIVISNSIASVDRWEEARKWLLSKLRIVALFDLPPNIFADTGVNTTIIVAYKPTPAALKTLQARNYSVFIKRIDQIGYEIRTAKRCKFYNPIYKMDPTTFDILIDENGEAMIDEAFTSTITEFKAWCLGQEAKLQELFIENR